MKLPPPKHSLKTSKWASLDDDDDDAGKGGAVETPVWGQLQAQTPRYGSRRGWVPKTPQDFADGGAFPEIHVAQFPLGMGKSKSGPQNQGTLALQTDETGQVRYDVVLHQESQQGTSGGKVVYAKHSDLAPMDVPNEGFAKPSDEELQETTDKTKEALSKIVDFRVKSAKATASITGNSQVQESKYIRYTPADAASQEDGSGTKIIRMTQAPVDPFEPPKFRIRKVPRGPGSPPPPVMHSPPRKVSAEEQKNWVIPACISNWKNNKGYTIPLDKRLAADGRGLQEVTINDNFAKLSEALFIADRHAREEVKLRSEMQAKLASKEKKEKEERLRMLAQKAREERAGLVSGGRTTSPDRPGSPSHKRGGISLPDYGSSSDETSGSESEEEEEELTQEEKQRLKEREQIRRDKAKQREKELRLSHMGTETKARVLSESADRDISEKIALGLAKPTLSKETLFDSRLFNQSHGMSSGFGAEDDYSLYDKPLFSGSSAAAIYRPKRSEEASLGGVSADRIEKIVGGGKPHKGFKGAESTAASDAPRDGPVQFEKEVDPFGFSEFMGSAKRGRDGEGGEQGESSKKSRA